MKNIEYIIEAIQTKSGLRFKIDESNEDVLHAILGLSSESGELADNLKKHLFYGKPLDKTNLKEELGDLFWYIAVLCNWLDMPFEDIMQMNIDKLRLRYGDKFSADKALNRNLDKERKLLDSYKDTETP